MHSGARLLPLALLLALQQPPPAFAAPAPGTPGRPAARPRTPAYPLAEATTEEVKARLGEPAVANAEGKGAFWTYRMEDCALMVFFKDAGQGLRVSGVTTGPRRRGETAPDAEACIASQKRTP